MESGFFEDPMAIASGIATCFENDYDYFACSQVRESFPRQTEALAHAPLGPRAPVVAGFIGLRGEPCARGQSSPRAFPQKLAAPEEEAPPKIIGPVGMPWDETAAIEDFDQAIKEWRGATGARIFGAFEATKDKAKDYNGRDRGIRRRRAKLLSKFQSLKERHDAPDTAAWKSLAKPRQRLCACCATKKGKQPSPTSRRARENALGNPAARPHRVRGDPGVQGHPEMAGDGPSQDGLLLPA